MRTQLSWAHRWTDGLALNDALEARCADLDRAIGRLSLQPAHDALTLWSFLLVRQKSCTRFAARHAMATPTSHYINSTTSWDLGWETSQTSQFRTYSGFRYDLYNGWYLPSNAILRNVEINFQGQTFLFIHLLHRNRATGGCSSRFASTRMPLIADALVVLSHRGPSRRPAERRAFCRRRLVSLADRILLWKWFFASNTAI